MNKKHLTFAVLYGSMMGLLLFNGIKPRSKDVVLTPDSEGSYPELIEEDGLRVETREFGNDSLLVTFEAEAPWIHYVIGLTLAVLLGQQHYRYLRKPAKEHDGGHLPSSNEPPHEDPFYEEFLKEDTNRRLFPRGHLKEEFEAWQENQIGPKERR